MIIGRVYTKSFWQEMSLKALRSLWISLDIKRFCETTWKWTMFWIHVIYELFIFYPKCYDMWFPGNYLARYYSLCDIGILAPVFVMVFGFCLCDDDEFRLCDDLLVHSLWWRWVPSLWQQMSFVFVTALSRGL